MPKPKKKNKQDKMLKFVNPETGVELNIPASTSITDFVKLGLGFSFVKKGSPVKPGEFVSQPDKI